MSEKQKKFSKIEYINEFNKKNYVGVSIRVRPEDREFIKGVADKKGMSVAQLIVEAVKKFN